MSYSSLLLFSFPSVIIQGGVCGVGTATDVLERGPSVSHRIFRFLASQGILTGWRVLLRLYSKDLFESYISKYLRP